MIFIFIVLLAALAFEYLNGFHDAANSIATVVSTKVLTPRQAIIMAAVMDLAGALIMGTSVATTVGTGLVDTTHISMHTVFCALVGAIVWDIVTWWFGLPSSSSHALIGGLCGAALASAHNDWGVLFWATGLWPKVVLPMIISPVVGFCVAAIMMALLYVVFRHKRPRIVNKVFGVLQIFSAMGMGFSHGSNDAQKTMGVITLALFTATTRGTFKDLPDWLSFMQTGEYKVHVWVIVTCACAMALGTATGGWRIIKTMGHKVVRLLPVNGFAAETSATCVIVTATHFGVPLSTTHVISSAIMGVGSVKRFSAVKWGVVGRIVWAWVLTIPISGLIGFTLMHLAHLLFAF